MPPDSRDGSHFKSIACLGDRKHPGPDPFAVLGAPVLASIPQNGILLHVARILPYVLRTVDASLPTPTRGPWVPTLAQVLIARDKLLAGNDEDLKKLRYF